MGVQLRVRSFRASDVSDELVYEFDQDRILIGRGRGADVCLPDRSVSLRHASVEHSRRGYTLVDHDATNGTRVDGARIVPGRAKPLRDGDRIEIGTFALSFRSGVAVASSTSAERTASLARRLAREALGSTEEEARPSITVCNGAQEGERLVLPEPPARFLIGRGESCQLCLRDADASREHAEIEVGLDGARIRDLDSKNGISIAGRAVRERLLDDRDEVRVGATILRYEDPGAARVRALEQGEDEAIEAPSWVPPSAEPVADEESELPPEPVPKHAVPRKPSIAPADMVIYILAAAVFAISLLGLLWLVRSG